MAAGTYVRLIVINVVVLFITVALLFGGYLYYINSVNYVTTSDATVTGTIIPITVPYAGKLRSWNVAANEKFVQGDALGKESNASVLEFNPGLSSAVTRNKGLANRLQSEEWVLAPITGTVIQNEATNGEIVQPGQVLARMVDLGALNVTANVPETVIRNVSVGQSVNVNIDGVPNTTFKGTVQSIGDATTSVFSLVPNLTAASGAYTKVQQRVPVVISLNGGYGGKTLVPGMSATVSIQVNNNA